MNVEDYIAKVPSDRLDAFLKLRKAILKTLPKGFAKEYLKVIKHKIDMGKSCIKFKYLDEIHYDLISELVSKMSVDEWLREYELKLKK